MHELLKDCPVIVEIPVRWGDMDAFQHVNNTIYFRYFETCRIEYYEKVGLIALMEEQKISSILASSSCRFKAPVTYPDKLYVGARMVKLNEERFLQEYRIISEKLGRLVAVGEALNVAYDYVKLQKSKFPAQILQSIRDFEKNPIEGFKS